MTNSIAFRENYTSILDEVYMNAATSGCLNSGRNIVREGRHAKEILIPKIEVTGLGDYTRNEGYKTGSITFEYETKTFNYDRGIRLMADVMDVEEAAVFDCFVAAGSELQRTQVAPEADAFTYATIASYEGIGRDDTDFSEAEAGDVLAALRDVTSSMDEAQVSSGSRYLFITPTLKGLLDDFSLANPTRSNRVLERFARIVEVPQSRFYSSIELLSGEDDSFGFMPSFGRYEGTTDTDIVDGKTYYTANDDMTVFTPVKNPVKSALSTYLEQIEAPGLPINFLVVEKSAVIKYDKHIASRMFNPDELETLDSYMLKYRKYGIVELFDNKLAGVHASISTL